jgi:hypothetical protein
MSANNKDMQHWNPPYDPRDPCASLAAFACEHCGGIAPFRRVDGGFQQRSCPDHLGIMPDGSIARAPYLQETSTPGHWLVWSRLSTGKLDIFGLELPQACIPIDDDIHEEA